MMALATDIDELEHHIERFGSVVAMHPSVWGQARLTAHREEYEKEMLKDLDKFEVSLQGSIAQSDQAYLATSLSLSAAATSSDTRARNNTTVNTAVPIATGPPLPDLPGDPFGAFKAISRSEAKLPPVGTLAPAFAYTKAGITLEPTAVMNQKNRYLNYLQELRRINEGDDTADSPGYSLNLVRIPVSVLPGHRTDRGHGAEVTMALKPVLGPELLPTTFRNLMINDVIEQLALPITEYINDPCNQKEIQDQSILSRSVQTYQKLASDRKNRNAMNYDEKVSILRDLLPRPLFQKIEKLANAASRRENEKDVEIVRLTELMARQSPINPPKQAHITPVSKAHRAILPFAPSQLDEVYQSGMWQTLVLQAYRRLSASRTQDYPCKSRNRNSASLCDCQESDLKQEQKLPCGKLSSRKTGKDGDGVIQTSGSTVPSSEELRSDESAGPQIVPDEMIPNAPTPLPPECARDKTTVPQKCDTADTTFQSTFVPRSACLYLHLPDVQSYLLEEATSAYRFLSHPANQDFWHLCTPELAAAIRAHRIDLLEAERQKFLQMVGPRSEDSATMVALAWGILVEAALLNDRLVADMKELSGSKGCPLNKDWLPYFLPDPPPEAREAFNQYVACRWPIHVFALDPVTDQQNIASLSLQRREMQLAMSLAFVSGDISARTMTNYARRIERDLMTIELNNTAVGFAHGDETFGWRFYPRFQAPPIRSNFAVLVRDLWIGGPTYHSDMHFRRLEPGIRECVAIVLMPSFVPYAKLDVTSNWFCLTNPKHKVMDSTTAMKLSRAVKTIETCSPNVYDAESYRDGDFPRLLEKAKQLEARLPMQTLVVQVPFENTLGGFAMFNTGITDLAPNLTGWYGASFIDPKKSTTLFLVGDHFSVHQTKVVAGGVAVQHKLLSRQVMQATIPAGPQVLNTKDGECVDVHIATPYGVTPHLLIPVCRSATEEKKDVADGLTWSTSDLELSYKDGVPLPPNASLSIILDADVPPPASRADVMIQFAFPASAQPLVFPNLLIKDKRIGIPVEVFAWGVFKQLPPEVINKNLKFTATVGPATVSFRNEFGHPLCMQRITTSFLKVTWTAQLTKTATSSAPNSRELKGDGEAPAHYVPRVPVTMLLPVPAN